MIANAETDQSVSRSGAAWRSVAVMAGWYAAALLALAAWLGPELAKPTVEPAQPCTAKTLACFQWTSGDTLEYLVLPILLSCLVMSFITLALMVRGGHRATAAGTAAAITGWLAGPVALLLLIEAWFGVLATIKGFSR